MFSCKQKHFSSPDESYFNYKSAINPFISAVTQLITINLLLWSKPSFTLLASKQEKSHVFHIISLYTQFADRGLSHHALYASWRGSVLLACPLPQHPLPLIGQLPVMTPSLLNLKGVSLLDQILCRSHKWGYWGFLQRFEPQEIQPKTNKVDDNRGNCKCGKAKKNVFFQLRNTPLLQGNLSQHHHTLLQSPLSVALWLTWALFLINVWLI